MTTPLLTAGVWFSAGAFIQSLLLLLVNGRLKVRYVFFWIGVFALALFGSFFVGKTLGQILPFRYYLIGALIGFSVLLALIFRNKILPRLDEQTLLVWNLLFLYIYFTQLKSGTFFDIVIILITLPVLINAFSPWSPPPLAKAGLYIWFLIMTAALGLSQFAFGAVGAIFTTEASTIGGINALLSGMALFYLFVTLWWIIRFIPVPRTLQSEESRWKELGRDLAVVSTKYEITPLQPMHTFILLVIAGGVLGGNYFFQLAPDWSVVNALVIATPILNNFH